MKFSSTCNAASVGLLVALAPAQTIVRTIPGVPATSIDVGGDVDSDGYVDVVVGNEYEGTGNKGAVRVISGKHIVTGAGPAVLATRLSTVAGERLGSSVAWITPSLFVAGAPENSVAASDAGALYLFGVNTGSSTVALYSTIHGSSAGEALGAAVANLGFWDADSQFDVAVGAPFAFSGSNPAGVVRIYEVQIVIFPVFTWQFSAPTMSFTDGFAGSDFGCALSSADFGNLAGNGTSRELVVGARYSASPFPPFGSGAGTLRVYALAPGAGGPTLVGTVAGATGELLGRRVDAGADFDGDGVPEVVASGGLYTSGYAATFSGGGLAGGQGLTQLHRVNYEQSSSNYGASIESLPDLNFDGRGEFAVGAPDQDVVTLGDQGVAQVFSGETGQPILRYSGGYSDESVGSAVAAYPGGWLLVGSYGSLRVLSLFPVVPSSHCTGKTNSSGCVPAVSWTGSPDVNSPAAFDVRCTQVLNQRNGLIFYGLAPNADPFQGGTLCAAQPLRRTELQNSGGNAIGTDCSGIFSYDFNARIQSGVDPSLVVGQEVFAQYWSRDPASPSTTSLSNALRFVVNP